MFDRGGWGRGRARGQRNQYRVIPALMGPAAVRPSAVDDFTFEENQLYDILINKLKTVQGKRKVFHSKSDLETIGEKTVVLVDVHETLKAAVQCDGKAKTALQERADRLLRSVRLRERLSAEEVRNFGLELRRLQRIQTLFRLEMTSKDMQGELQTAFANARSELLSQQKYSLEKDGKIEEMLKDIGTKCRILSEVVTRKMIVKAIGLTPGHWFKCPNGHLYVIGECGGAVVESRCPECNAVIGGSGHRLRADNSVATEMDGATRSAYDINVAVYRGLR